MIIESVVIVNEFNGLHNVTAAKFSRTRYRSQVGLIHRWFYWIDYTSDFSEFVFHGFAFFFSFSCTYRSFTNPHRILRAVQSVDFIIKGTRRIYQYIFIYNVRYFWQSCKCMRRGRHQRKTFLIPLLGYTHNNIYTWLYTWVTYCRHASKQMLRGMWLTSAQERWNIHRVG